MTLATPKGYRWVWVPDSGDTAGPSGDWRFGGDGRCCRMIMAGHARCPNPAVAALNRGAYTPKGRRDSWWYYCAEHLYGRRIRDGVVEHRRLVPDEVPG